MKSALTIIRPLAIFALLGICWVAQPALASPYLVNPDASVTLNGGNEDMFSLFSYRGDPTKQFNKKADATREYQITINRSIFPIESGQELRIMLPEQISVTVVHKKTFITRTILLL